jgi:hypothetical protein
MAVRDMLAGRRPVPAPEPARQPAAAATHHRIIEGSAYTDKAGQTVHRRQNIGRVVTVT